jgi:hypothetical protein
MFNVRCLPPDVHTYTSTLAGPFGELNGTSLEEHTRTGTLVNTFNAVLTPTDFREGLQLPNGCGRSGTSSISTRWRPTACNWLVSVRDTDAVYLINGRTAGIIWKLGGSQTGQRLTILNGPDASTDFGGQRDARVLPNADISLGDDGAGTGRPPRVLVFQFSHCSRPRRWCSHSATRPVPVLPGVFAGAQLQAAMDTMYGVPGSS